jgi:hypothetical protein
MSKLLDINDPVVAEGRDWLGPLQCVRPFPEASREEPTVGAQDGRDQESKPCQECGTRPKEEGEILADMQTEYKLIGHA